MTGTPDTPPLPLRSQGQPIVTAGGAFLVIAALYFGQGFFIPFILAVLLAFALSPIVNRLRRWQVPNVAAVVFAVTLSFIIIGGVSYVVGNQLVSLAEDIPTYRTTMVEKIRALRHSEVPGGGLLERLTDTFQGVEKELSGSEEDARNADEGGMGTVPEVRPVPVTIESSQSPLAVLGRVLGPVVEALATAGIVIVFVVFVLLEKEDLRDRFINISSSALAIFTPAQLP